MSTSNHASFLKTRKALINKGIPQSRVPLKGAWNLRGVDLRDLEIKNANFGYSQTDLTGANLQGVILTSCNFSGCSLFGARLDSSVLDRSFFDNADLTACSLFDARLINPTDLSISQLAKAIGLEKSILNSGRYADAALVGYIPVEEKYARLLQIRTLFWMKIEDLFLGFDLVEEARPNKRESTDIIVSTLKNRDILYVGDLVSLTNEKLRIKRNIGINRAKRIIQAVELIGLRMDMSAELVQSGWQLARHG